MSTQKILHLLVLAASVPAFCACNTNDSERFNSQKESYVFESTTMILTAFGASQLSEDDSGNSFRCPSVSGMSSESSLTLLRVQANAPAPHFTISTISGIRSDDASGAIGISMSQLPIGMLDIYRRCNATSSEALVTSCPQGYSIVSACTDSSAKECAPVYTGTHKLVISSQYSDDLNCYTEENDRSPYASQSVPDVAYACDAFDSMPVIGAYRGKAPSDGCCSLDTQSSLDFCLKPCGCRKLTVQIVPKSEALDDSSDGTVPRLDNSLRIAAFSNVEGNEGAFRRLLDSVKSQNVDLVISIGNLTKKGTISQFSKIHDIVVEKLQTIDGQDTSSCTSNDEQICCTGSDGRQFSSLCNVIAQKTPFLASLGDNETGLEDPSGFVDLFGPSNTSTTMGKVQIIMLDSADATLGSAEKSWLRSVLDTPEETTCQIPAPSSQSWPTLSECREILGYTSASDAVTCRECIAAEAYCIPPDSSRSDYSLGPENCVCVPLTSDVCMYDQSCSVTDGTEGTCMCTRDADCGDGGSCNDGVCAPPIRLVFTFTPLFDKYGTRNDAFTSKDEAASLLSMLIRSGVGAVIAGRSRDYSSYEMGGIPMYITGGGGADMASFADKGHHWLLIDIPNAYTSPTMDQISFKTIEF